MMKFAFISSFALFLILASCSQIQGPRETICLRGTENVYPPEPREPSICTTDTCTEYFTIWEELIREKNNLSDDFLQAHIEPYYVGTNNWTKGISFRVCYTLKVDWAITNVCDQFMIRIDPDNASYPHLDLPRDRKLTKEEIASLFENRIFNSFIATINNTTEVEHSSMENALNDLIEFSGLNTLCFNKISLNKDNGNLTLHALAQYENEENSCVNGSFDLITGEKTILDNRCYIID